MDYRPPGNLSALVTRPHSALTNLDGDQHPRHAFLDGRSGGQVFYGCQGSAENFDLDTVSGPFAAANTGRLRFLERVTFFPNSVTLDNTAAGNRTMIRVPTTTTWTIGANLSPTMFSFEPKIIYGVDAQAGARGYYSAPTISLVVSQSDWHGIGGFQNLPTIRAESLCNVFLDPVGAFEDAPTFIEAGSGTFKYDTGGGNLSAWTGFHSNVVATSTSSGTINSLYGFRFDASNLGDAIQATQAFLAALGGRGAGAAVGFKATGTGGGNSTTVGFGSDLPSSGALNLTLASSNTAPSIHVGNFRLGDTVVPQAGALEIGSGTIVNTAGVAAVYNSDVTAGNGLASIVGNELLTVRSYGTGAGVVRSLFVTKAAGLYGFQTYMVVQSAGNPSSTISPKFFWVDDVQSQSFLPTSGLLMTTLGTYVTKFVTTNSHYPSTFRAASGTLISYQTTASNPCSAGRYLIHVAVTRFA